MNTSDPKQQKQLLILILLVVLLGAAIYYQTSVSKPDMPTSISKKDPKAGADGNLVEVASPFMRPTGAERDPFATPALFDELADAPASATVTSPSKGVRGQSSLMPLPNLPQGGVVTSNAGNTTTAIPMAPVVKLPPDFRLIGTIVGTNQMAIIRGPNGGDQVALGDQAADGSRLVAVTRETAVFVKEGKSYMLTVGEE